MIKNIEKFESIYNQYNKFYIDWDFHFNCNYNCEYCFQKWNNYFNTKKPNLKNIKIVLKFLRKIKYDFTLGLLGGEPTLYENVYFYILEELDKILQIKKYSDVYVSTNFSKPIDFYKKHKYYKNIHQWLSIHLKYFSEDFFEKCLILKDKTDKIIISPILSLDYKKYLKIIEKLYDFAIKNDFEYSPQFLYKNQQFDQYYILDSKNKLFNQNKKEFLVDDKLYTLNEILNETAGNIAFKNYICYANYLDIDPFNILSFSCLKQYYNLNKEFSKCIKLSPKSIRCPFKNCNDFPKLLSKKIKKV